jgi:hypothetical protein
MGNPSSHYDFRHTCPTCNRPVKHGDKFCEVCGTKIPSLSTCSKCGTQFIHPKKFCDLCGAPFILEEVAESEADEILVPGLEEIPVPESDEVPEPDQEELPEPAEEETPEPDTDETEETDVEELPELDADELPEPDEEELPAKSTEKTPKHYEDDVLEPDTDELLEKYGGEYDDDATLETYHKVKLTSPIQHKAKKPVTVPAPPRQGSPDAVDDALFLLDEGSTPAKPPVNKIMIIGGIIGLISILAIIFFIGQPLLMHISGLNADSNPVSAEITPLPTITTPTAKLTPASGVLVPQPTQTIPTDQKIFFHVRKDPITSKILVIFTGPAGSGSISSADVRVTHADGSVTMGVILPLKGVSEITLAGSKETDRVEIIAKMSTGETYRVFDDLVPFIR